MNRNWRLLPYCFFKQSFLSVSSNQVFLVTVWNFELYMIPLALSLLFVYNFIRPTLGKVGSIQDSQVSKDSNNSDIWLKKKCVSSKPPPPNHDLSPLHLRSNTAHVFMLQGRYLSCVIWSLLPRASRVPESWPAFLAWVSHLVLGQHFHAGSTCLRAHLVLHKVPGNEILNH